MTTPSRRDFVRLPEPIQATLTAFEQAFGLGLRLLAVPAEPGAAAEVLHATPGFASVDNGTLRRTLDAEGRRFELEVAGPAAEARADALALALETMLQNEYEIRLFTSELTEKFEEINLLYSISEILGRTLELDAAAEEILHEVCDVLGARRGSLWVHDEDGESLRLVAQVGDGGRQGPLSLHDPDAVTSMVFRDGRAVIDVRERAGGPKESFLSVPIRYTPPAGVSRTVGVVNLFGRKSGEKFSAADQKLLAAIASQVGAALENNRLVRESLLQERMSREMELAHDLQMKLLPVAERFVGAEVSARVEPTVQVGGDFYQLFRLSGGRVGVMLGDVSLHGFPSALIMTLAMSAVGIYAQERESPDKVLRGLDDSLRDELETTEMFLTAFYAVIDPEGGRLVYSNAGHPHAFLIHPEGEAERLIATDPPVGFAGPEAYGQRSIPWRRGDLLLLFTDGLPDTLASAQRGDGEERVLDVVVANRRRPVREIVDLLFQLTAAAGPRALSDDRTALVLRT